MSRSPQSTPDELESPMSDWPGSWQGKRNRIQCRKCSDIIEATHQHDFKSCKCGFVSIDGGCQGHWRRLWKEGDPKEAFEEMP